MSQSKGVLPTRAHDREVLYRNPQTCGYFIAARLDPAVDRARLRAWLQAVDGLVEVLVARDAPAAGQEKGGKVAAVAVGLAPAFFAFPNVTPPIDPPASFSPGIALPDAGPPLNAAPKVEGEVMFYVASVREAPVNAFVSSLAAVPGTAAVRIDRGYQRDDETEQFGYKDGVRNSLPKGDRPRVVFVHRDGAEADEPDWADGGTYLAYMKLRQYPQKFAALPDDTARDNVMGRNRDGVRLDLVGTETAVADEPDDMAALPATSHVRKTGPRGKHDAVQIFRRGLPYMETTTAGELAVGLQFCSFQAALEQFDVVYNDWAVNRRFPQPAGTTAEPGPDALLDPAAGLVTTERVGFFFVPPHHPEGLAAAVLPAEQGASRRRTGRLVVRKRIVNQADPAARFERDGFRFVVLDDQGAQVGAEFETDLTGRAVCPHELDVGRTYTLRETFSPLPGVAPGADVHVVMDRPNKTVPLTNKASQATPYGGT